MKSRIYLFIILLLAAAEPVNSWYSQLFPYNAGSYDEATVTFNARAWRLLDYSYTGYNLGETPLQTGIPCNVRTVAGTGDITVELQNLINTVGGLGGGIVKIPAGTYTITQTAAGKPIGINYDNVSVEGAGSGYTVINIPATHAYNDDSNDFEGVFTFEKTYFDWNKGWVEGGTDISHVTNTIAEGSVYITGLTNLAAVNAGTWIVVQQYFWAAFCTANSNGAWPSGDPGNREYSFTYLRKVLSKDASGITVDSPIPYALNPANNTIYIKTSGTTNGMLQNVGISGMTIQFADNNNGFGTRAGFPSGCAVYFEGVVNGWVKDVAVINFPRYGIHPDYSARITIEDCYVKKTQDYGGGGAGYGFYVNCSQNILIKRCHGEQTRHNFILSRALAHYVVMTQCESFDAAQLEDTHFGFSHALLRDKFIMGNGNAYNGYNRWTTSGDAYESFGTGAVWNLYGDGYGGQWHGAELNINPSVNGYAMEVGVAGSYIVNDGAGYAPSGTYVVGTTMANNAGLQVGPASWRQNVLYEGVGYQPGLLPGSLYEEQLKNRVGTVADWANICGDAATMTPVPTNTPVLTPGILVFDSEIPAFGLGLGSAAATPATTITPGNNPNDAGQNRTINGAESFRLTSASADWGIVANFGGPVMNTSSLLRFEGWVFITDANFNFRLQLQNPAGTDIGSSVVVNNTFADGGVFNVNQWNHFQINISSFGYTGTFTGIGMRTGTLTANKTAWFDDFYFIPSSLPTATFTRTISFTATRTNTSGGTNTFTRTPSYTPTGTGTRTRTSTGTPTGTPVITATFTGSVSGTPTRTITNTVTATFTRTASPSATRTNTVIFTSTRTQTSTPVTGCGKRLLAYYPYWMSAYRQDKIPYNKLTHICHAFVQPQANGSLVAPVGPPAYIEPALITNAHANGVKVLVSVGGADSVADANFRTISASPALRTAFADAIEVFCRTNGYDGVDLDWEFPQDATDRTNQNLMVQAIRTKFNSSPAPAPSWLITSAVSSGNWYGQWNDYATLNAYMDFYNVMTYDYHGSWSAHSGHNSPIYQGTDPDAWDCIDYNMNYMLVTRGVPADKMNLGMPFYGRNFNNSEVLYDACGGSCTDTYYNYADMVALIGSGWTYNWDAAALVPYLTNDSGTGVLSYDNPQSIGLKVDYGFTTRSLGGVFMWDLSADYISGTGQPLMDAMYNAYSSFCGTVVPSASATASVSPLNTNTKTPTASVSQTPTNTRTWTRTATATATGTRTATRTNTVVFSPTFTGTHTASPQGTLTNSPTRTRTVTASFSPSITITSNLSPSFTATRTVTTAGTPSFTATYTMVSSATPTETQPSGSPTITPTITVTTTPDPCTCPSYFGKNVNSANPAGIYNYVEANKYVLAEDALVRALHVYVTSTAGAGRIRMAIYSDNGAAPNSVPLNMLVESSDVTVVQGWNVLDIADTSLTAGTYWIAVQAENGVALEYDEGTMGNEAWAPLAYGAFPATYPVGSWWNYEYSMYADYCPVVCGTPTYTRTTSPTATETNTASPVVSPTITPTLILSCECPDKLGMQYVPPGATGAANFIVANWYPMFEDGTAMSMEIYSTTGGGNAILAIYSEAGAAFNHTVPGTLISQSAPFALNTGWNTVPIPQVNLQANTMYWLAYITDTAAQISAEVGSAGDMQYVSYTFNTLPSNFGAASPFNYNWAMHVNYCPAVCPPTPTPTGTETPVLSPTGTPAGTLTNTPVVSATETPADTASPSATNTPVPTSTDTAQATATDTPLPTETDTPVPTSTFTLTATPTVTRTRTQTSTPTLTRTVIPFTPTYTVTPTSTPVIEDTMEILDVLPYPNPYSGGTGDLIISFDITRPANLIIVSIYSCGYRKVIEKEIPGLFLRGTIVTVERDRFERLASGVYYIVIKGENGAEKARSKPGKLIIIK